MNSSSNLSNSLKSPFVKKVLKGSFWLTLGSILSKGLVALAYLVLARILTVDAYGEYGMIKSTIDNFLIFASLGVGLTTTKYISELRKEYKEQASSILGTSLLVVGLLSLIVFLVLLLFSDYISSVILSNPTLETPLLLAGGVLIFVAMNGVILGAYLGMQEYRQVAIVNIIQGILLFGLLCAGGYYYGVVGAVLGNLLAMATVSLISFYILRKRVKRIGLKISIADFNSSLKTIYRFAIPASMGMILVAPSVWLLNTWLVNTPNGYYELGVYSAVMVFSMAIRTVNTSLSDTLLPIFLSNDTEYSAKKEFFNYHGPWLVCLAISMPLLLYPEMTLLFLGDKYPADSVIPITIISALMVLFIAPKQGISRDMIKKSRMWLTVLSTGIFVLTTLISFYFLESLGAIGFALAFLLGYSISTFVVIPLFSYLKVSPSFVFKNIWLLVILGLVIIICYNSLYVDYFWLRTILAFILVVLLIFSLMKFYSSFIKKTEIGCSR
ncbi:MAG: oligosaccharide flippase family protein [Marinirhabdus sp.]|nr:oligosaccharide flippase family protein [Marinirhabdus sp.]